MAVDSNLLLVLKSSMLGDGQPDLGEKLMKAFLTQLLDSRNYPAKIICMNSGIFLTTEGSSVLDIMKQFESQGTKIFSCGTCLDYFKKSDQLKIGDVGNMKDSVQALLSYPKIIQP
jgi:selenium metabolism protein YedF